MEETNEQGRSLQPTCEQALRHCAEALYAGVKGALLGVSEKKSLDLLLEAREALIREEYRHVLPIKLTVDPIYTEPCATRLWVEDVARRQREDDERAKAKIDLPTLIKTHPGPDDIKVMVENLTPVDSTAEPKQAEAQDEGPKLYAGSKLTECNQARIRELSAQKIGAGRIAAYVGRPVAAVRAFCEEQGIEIVSMTPQEAAANARAKRAAKREASPPPAAPEPRKIKPVIFEDPIAQTEPPKAEATNGKPVDVPCFTATKDRPPETDLNLKAIAAMVGDVKARSDLSVEDMVLMLRSIAGRVAPSELARVFKTTPETVMQIAGKFRKQIENVRALARPEAREHFWRVLTARLEASAK